MTNNTTKNEKSGFTLVELAIVLVIVGLLIGGILVAQSMINSTKVQAFTRQVGSFDAAMVTFADKYANLPGDSATFDSGVGNSNGIIGAGAAATYTGETANVWTQLQLTGLKREEGGGTYGTSYVINTDYPKAKIGSAKTGFWAYGEATPTVLGNLAAAANLYIVADCGAMTSTTLACSSGISGPDALAIDKKLDDGDGTTGSVTGFDGSGVATWAGLTDGTETAYDPTVTTNDSAILFIRIGVLTGELK